RDGKQVVYSARWNDGPTRLFLARSDGAKTDTPEFRVLESSPTVELASVSEDRVAFFEQAKEDGRYVLEWRALRSGTSHPVSDHIAAADWTPDGKLCLVRARAGTDTVEFPEGHPVYRSSGWISDLRVSPAGNEVAFLEHPLRTDDAGQVVAVDRSGRSHVLSAGWGSTDGLAWHPATDEVWFTAARSGIDRVLMAVNRRGRTRQIAQVPGGMRLLDVSATGQVLISRNTSHMLMLFGKLHESAARNISFLDWSCVAAISRDGQQVLFDESGAGGGQRYSVYLYTAQTQSSERLGDGRAMDLSADGRWALSQAFNDTHTLYLISTQSRKVATVSNYGFEYTWAKFLPGSGPGSPEILFEGNMPEEKPGLYRQRIPDGKPILVKPGIQLFQPVIDPQLQLLAGVNEDSNLAVLDLARRDMRIVRPSRPVFPVAFLAPGKLLTSHTNSASVLLDVLDPGTGELIPYKKLDPPDGAGTSEVFPIHFAGDLDTFAYSRVQSLSQLYSVSGWS
ncbi:MAG: hypothetical protein JO211_14945, partial [Acidobacteriaceae bacterium]|nr:hypothetical protein [Acidobacteriaceae bacterium]